MNVRPVESPDPHIGERLALLREETDPSFVTEIVAQFLTETQDAMQKLRDAIRSGDTMAIGLYAHKLKGANLNVGANKLAAMFERLETTMRESDVPPADSTMHEIEHENGKVWDYLRNLPAAQ